MGKNKEQIKYDVEGLLENYMPNLIKLLGNQDISWTAINKAYKNHRIKIQEKIKMSETGKIKKDTTIYSFIIGHIQEKKETAPEFDWFNTIFSELITRLSEDELIYVHKMIKPLLMNFDYNFRNFIGELATLNAYKSTGKYTLLNIEEKIYSQNNISADLFLKRNEDDKKFLVEIVNIHLEKQDINNFEELKFYLKSKIETKIKKTIRELPRQELYIQPIIWIKDEAQIKLVSEFYKKNILTIENVYIPMASYSYKEKGSKLFNHRFEFVTTILDDNIQISNSLNYAR